MEEYAGGMGQLWKDAVMKGAPSSPKKEEYAGGIGQVFKGGVEKD